VFNTLIDNNTLTNCANGINLAGGFMLSTYQTLAYSNIVQNNTIDNVLVPATFQSLYGGHTQYGNQFINNTITNSGLPIFTQQEGMVYKPAGANRLVYFKVSAPCTKFTKTAPSVGGINIQQSVCVVSNDGSGNGIWSALVSSTDGNTIYSDANYVGAGLIGASTQHTFMGWNATTGALQ
jgi:hypothetical protein